MVNTTPALYGRSYVDHGRRTGATLRELLHDGEILFSRWDATGLVTVNRKQGSLNLRVNGKVEASSEGDMLTQILTSHLPLIVHPSPRDVLVIGFGSGATAAAALRHDVAAVDCVELSPAVIEAAELFAAHLGHPRRDPRLSLTVGDARAHVRFADRTYDVIIAQPSNLWISGNGTLFTREHFERCRARLRPGGLMCQWLHGYRLPPADFRAVAATFAAVFQEHSLWEVSVGGDYLLLGGAPGLLRADRFARVRDHLSRWGVHKIDAIESCRLAGPHGITRLSEGVAFITDNHCHVEYSAPAGLAREETNEILETLAPLRGGKPRGRLADAQRAARLGRTEEALRLLSLAIPECAFDPAMLGVIEVVTRAAFQEALDAMDAGRRAEARRIFEAIPPDARNHEAAQEWARKLRH
jgi:SAM-dependent methyltransferase